MAPHYGAAWAWAGNTPFRWGKQVGSHLGGTRDPLVVHWPDRVTDAGGLRSQFAHVIDVAPTILEVAGIPAPSTVDGIEQEPMHGTSFLASLTDGDAPEHRTQQYFETVGNRAMYKDGWWLAMKTERIPWVLTPDALAPYAPGVWDPDAGTAELYYLPDDFTQSRDLADEHPDKVQELKDLFWEEAERYKVLPLLATLSTFFGILPPLPDEVTFEFRGDVQNVMPGMIPRVYNHSYSITADLVVPQGGAEGVIVAEADHLGGFTLYVKDGKLTHTYSMMGVSVFKQVAEEDLPTGDVTVRMQFEADEAKARDRRRGDPVHRRPTGRQGPDGPHGPDPVLRLRGDGHRAGQRRRRRPELREREAVRVHRHGEEGGLRPQAPSLGPGRAPTARRGAPRPVRARPRRMNEGAEGCANRRSMC